MFERMSRRGARIGRRGEKKGGAPLQRSVWLHLQLRWLLFEIMQLRLGYLGIARPGGTTFSHLVLFVYGFREKDLPAEIKTEIFY